MAAKQGLTAHLSQASEDARRAVLSRAPTSIKSHSWLSNLNTTCTIKSAPPRTPEVMTLLSNKSGWLVKRNEQHVWQRRWCCVVPHTFLYYFEAEPLTNYNEDGEEIGENGDYGNDGYETKEGFSGGGIYRSEDKVVENQDLLNAAVRDGFQNKNKASHVRSRSSTPLRGRAASGGGGNGGSNSNMTGGTDDGDGGMGMSTSAERNATPLIRGPKTAANGKELLPAGIIDLECYSSVVRCPTSECLFELTGDEVTNPDLRSFFFQAGSVEDCETWTTAFLSDRHSALKDERDAYKQVCDSFQLQLQNLSDMIDEAEGKASDTEGQLYKVRSAVEKRRNEIINIVRDLLENKCWVSSSPNNNNSSSRNNHNSTETERLTHQLEKTRRALLDQLDEILTSNNDENSASLVVQLLAGYISSIAGSYSDLTLETSNMQQKLNSSVNTDKAIVSELKAKIERLEAEQEEERAQHKGKLAGMETKLQEAQSMYEETHNHLQTQQMETKMFQNQAKTKLQEISQHKKILKKEVIDLRKKFDEIGSERDAALHAKENMKLQIDAEKQKNAVLEKYIEKMENQVTVQQNMMEMISLSGMSQAGGSYAGGHAGGGGGGGSVVGKVVGGTTTDNDNQSVSSAHNRSHQRLPPSNLQVRDASPLPNRLPPSMSQNPRSPPRSQKKEKVEMTSPLTPPTPSPTKKDRRRESFTIENPSPSIQTPKISKNSPQVSIDDKYLDEEDERIEKRQQKNMSQQQNQSGSSSSNRRAQDSSPSMTHSNRVNRYQRNLEKKVDTSRNKIPLANTTNGHHHTASTTESRSYRDHHGGEQDDDEKSHESDYSELTEDRTQRAMDLTLKERQELRFAMSDMTEVDNEGNGGNAIQTSPTDELAGPPRYIGTENNRPISDNDVDSRDDSRQQMSVAQRARLDADSCNKSQTLSVTIPPLPMTPAKSVESSHVRSQSPSVFSGFGSRLMNAMDNSIIGVGSNLSVASTDSKDLPPPSSAQKSVNPSSEKKLTLQERQKLQRERQMQVLKKKGLIK